MEFRVRSDAIDVVNMISNTIKNMDKSLDTIQLRVNHYIGQSWISEAATSCKGAIDGQVTSAKKYFTDIQVYLDAVTKKINESFDTVESQNQRLTDSL